MKCKHGIYGCITCYREEVDNALKGKPMTKPTTVNAKTLIEMGAPKYTVMVVLALADYGDVDIRNTADKMTTEGDWLRKNFPWCFDEKPKRYRNKISYPFGYLEVPAGTIFIFDNKMNAYCSEDRQAWASREAVENNRDLFEEVR